VDNKDGNGTKRLAIIRGYVILVLGIGLVLYGLLRGVPAILTLGAGFVGLNPVVVAAS